MLRVYRVVRFWDLFLWRNARSPDDECGRHQVFSRNDGIYAHHEDRKTNTGQKVMFFRYVKRATLTRYGNKRIEYFFATRNSVWTALSLLENSKLIVFAKCFTQSCPLAKKSQYQNAQRERLRSWQIRTRGVICLSCRERCGLLQVPDFCSLLFEFVWKKGNE